jgi:hypothetical protein
LYGVVLEVVQDEAQPLGMIGKRAVFVYHKAAR